MKTIELESCVFSDDGEVEIAGVGVVPREEMEHIVYTWLDLTSSGEDDTPKTCQECRYRNLVDSIDSLFDDIRK